MVLLNTLVFLETAKNNKIKNKVTCLQQSTKKGLQMSRRQTGLRTSTGLQINIPQQDIQVY